MATSGSSFRVVREVLIASVTRHLDVQGFAVSGMNRFASDGVAWVVVAKRRIARALPSCNSISIHDA
jgi:hypothetical protein